MGAKFLPTTIIAVVFFTVLFVNPVNAADSLQVANVQFEATADQIIVTYDLLPPSDPVLLRRTNREYKITLLLKREQDESFQFAPRYVTGDVGTGITEGTNKRAVWQISRELPKGLEGDDFYFIVQVDALKERSTMPWLWIGAGAAVVGGTIAAILIFRGDINPPTTSKFPEPPGRP